jgi:soluble epoxide hydrolase / lipid-phosphate phosphatase
LPDWLDKDYADVHTKLFTKHGYTGPLNWYKASLSPIDAQYYEGVSDEDKKIEIPSIVVPARFDAACRPEVAASMAPKFLTNHRLIPMDCGHWVPHEKPNEAANAMIELAKELA